MNFSWAMDLDPKGASNQIKELIDRHYGNDDEIMIHSNSNGANGGNNYSIQDASASSASNTPNTTPFQQRSTLTPTGAGVAGPSGAGPSSAGVSGSAGASTSNSSNGSNNSNNISNNTTRHRPVNTMRRYIIHEFDGDMNPIDEDEDEDDEQPDDEDDDETLDETNELADSTNILDADAVSFSVDAPSSDNADGTFNDDDSLML